MTVHIALLLPNANVSTTTFMHAIRARLRTLFGEEHLYTIYHEDGIGRLTEALQEGNYDALVTYGMSNTQQARALLKKTQRSLPLVCWSIAPIEREPGEKLINISASLRSYTHNLFLIFPFIPMIRKALILYDPENPLMVQLQEQFAAHLRERADEKEIVTAYPLRHTLIRRDILLLAEHHIVIVLTQHPETTFIQRLARLCSEHKTVLYMTESNAVHHGAGLGMGLNDTELGNTAATLVHRTLTAKNKPLPADVTLPCQLRINAQALAQQGVPMMRITPLLSLIASTTMVTPEPQEKVSAYLRMEQIPLE